MHKYLKAVEIAAFYRVSTQTIDVWAKEGKVKVFRTPSGRPRYLNPEWVEPVEVTA